MTGRREIEVVTLFRSRARMRCPEVRIVAIPNAAKRGQKALNGLRREGAAFGFPDLMALWPGGGVAFVEFKRETGGTVSANQEEWIWRLNDLGFAASVQTDADQALSFLREQGAPFL